MPCFGKLYFMVCFFFVVVCVSERVFFPFLCRRLRHVVAHQAVLHVRGSGAQAGGPPGHAQHRRPTPRAWSHEPASGRVGRVKIFPNLSTAEVLRQRKALSYATLVTDTAARHFFLRHEIGRFLPHFLDAGRRLSCLIACQTWIRLHLWI